MKGEEDGSAAEAETQGIFVQSSPLFITESSQLTTYPQSYFWAYRIRMWMPDNSEKNKRNWQKCTLTTRHWIITDATGHVEEVDGPGVIGMYPVMQPGAYFSYESCSQLRTSSGSMKGSFRMITPQGEQFDIVVPEMKLIVPYGWLSSTVSSTINSGKRK